MRWAGYLRQRSLAALFDLKCYVARLPDRARIVFVLHAIEGYRHYEIEAMTNMAVGTSKAQFHRAKQLLKGWMGYE
jgi:RNA polymerase sigma-70 factor (ECF subfamily)